MAARKRDCSNAICCLCGGRETYMYQGSPKWYRCSCGRGHCTGFLCNKCYMIKQNNLPDSHMNIKRKLRYSDKLCINTESGIGILGECIVANVLNIRNCDNCKLSKKDYDWSHPYDLEKNGNKIQVKTRAHWYGQYSFNIGNVHNFDILYIVCLDDVNKNIRKIYVIPEIKLSDLKGITIYENSSTGDLYEEFLSGDIKLYCDVYFYIMERLENCLLLKL